MADQDKGKFSADIGQDVIEEALRSVQRRKGPDAGGTAAGGDAAEPEATAAAGGDATAAEAQVAPEQGGSAPEPSPEQKELEALRAQLEFSQEKGRELMAKVKDEHERVLRATADLDNFRKRAAKEKEEIQKYGIEKLLKDFLPVVDNLDRGLEHAKSPADFDSLLQGIKMTKKLFEDALGKHGVRGFSARGKPFDPRMHEAMQQVETDELPPNHVYQEVLRGYVLNDRLVRPALVMVTKAPEKAPKAEGVAGAEAAGGAGETENGAGGSGGGSAAS